MEFQEDDDEDDAVIQYVIEQSLLESNKQKEPLRDCEPPHSRRLEAQCCSQISRVYTGS